YTTLFRSERIRLKSISNPYSAIQFDGSKFVIDFFAEVSSDICIRSESKLVVPNPFITDTQTKDKTIHIGDGFHPFIHFFKIPKTIFYKRRNIVSLSL